MAYSDALAERVRSYFSRKPVSIEEKRMMGGLLFMINGKMCVGVHTDELMLRVGPKKYDTLLAKDGVRPMDFTGKVMKGYLFVKATHLDTESDLHFWLGEALEFNKEAKAAKKKSSGARVKSARSRTS